MKTLAILVAKDFYPSRPDRDDPEYTRRQLETLAEALKPHGIGAEPVFWHEDGTDWTRFDAVSPLLAWNYPAQKDMFMNRLAEIERSGAKLLNSGEVIRDNMDKAYLARLSDLGAPVPPTVSLETCSEAAILACFDRFGADEIIIKPRIGAGAWRQVRLKRGQAVPAADLLPPDTALVQPFLPAVTDEGELSLLYFGGTFSHGLIKKPKPGDYRTQGQYGAIETAIAPPPQALQAAEAVLKAAEATELTYARVDLVRGQGDTWLLMELELIEPWLYLTHDNHDGKAAARLFAHAVARAI